MKKQSKTPSTTPPIKKPSLNPSTPHSQPHYLKLSNEQYLLRTLKLLNISDSEFYKQTKLNLSQNNDQIFPNKTNPTNTKQFFYITYICLKNIMKNQQQFQQLSIWYPPRTVNQQLEYKKVLWKVLKNLENVNRIPKNVLLSKASIMSDGNIEKLVQFLRFISQLALRQQYLDKYSQKQRLIQITSPTYTYPSSSHDNDINRFYTYPFVATTDIQQQQQQLKPIIETYSHYIQIYLNKLTKLRTNQQLCQKLLPYQDILCRYTQQKQLNDTLRARIPGRILGQNRAFDRRRVLERNQEIWGELEGFNGYYLQRDDIPVIKLEGQIDQMLNKWNPTKGITNIIQANSLMNTKLETLKKQLKKSQQNFINLKTKISQQLITNK